MKKMPPEYLNGYIADDKHSILDTPGGGGGGGVEGTVIYGLD